MSDRIVTSQRFFVDREDSLQSLLTAFDKVSNMSESQSVFIVGEAGIGKTSLIQQFLSMLENNQTVVLTAKGFEEHEIPLFPFIEMMKNYLSTSRVIDREFLLESFLNLAKLIPILEPYISSAEQLVKQVRGLSDVDRYSVSNSYHVFSNYLSILQKIANKKILVLYVDDAQWLDNTSFELLAYLIRKIAERIMIIVSYRTGYITSQKELHAKEFFDRIVRTANQERSLLMDLRSMQEELYPQFISGFLGLHKFRKDDVHLLFEQTEGNPLFLRSLLELFKESKIIVRDNDGSWFFSGGLKKDLIPRNLFDTISRRLHRVYSDIPNSQTILDYACVMGYKFDLDMLGELLKRDKLEIFHILQKVENTYSIIRNIEESTTYVFDHRKTQETIYANLGRMAADCHRRIAESLESKVEKSKDPFLIAYHYERAQEWEKALKYLQISARMAFENYYYSDSVKQYEECFALIKDNNVQLADSEINSLKIDYAKSLLGNNSVSLCITNLSDLVQKKSLSEIQQAEAYLLLGRCYRLEGRGESGTRAIQSVEKSLEVYERTSDSSKLGEVYSYLATVYDHFGNTEKAIKCFEQSQIHYNLVNDGIGLARLQRKSGMIYEARRAIEFMKNALQIFEKYSMKIEKARCLNNIGAESFYTGDFLHAEYYLGLSLELFRSLDSPEVDIPLNNLGLVYQQKQERRKALQYFEDAHNNVSESFNEVFINMNMANIHRQMGELEKAKQIIVHLQPIVETYPEPVMNDYYGFNRSMIHYELNEFDDAEQWLLKFQPNNYKNDSELVLAKRYEALTKIYEKKSELKGAEMRQQSIELFKTIRPQRWYYKLDYYPCDIHIWD